MSGARVTVAAGRAGRDSTASGLDRPGRRGAPGRVRPHAAAGAGARRRRLVDQRAGGAGSHPPDAL